MRIVRLDSVHSLTNGSEPTKVAICQRCQREYVRDWRRIHGLKYCVPCYETLMNELLRRDRF